MPLSFCKESIVFNLLTGYTKLAITKYSNNLSSISSNPILVKSLPKTISGLIIPLPNII
jgi:hypothetical protein